MGRDLQIVPPSRVHWVKQNASSIVSWALGCIAILLGLIVVIRIPVDILLSGKLFIGAVTLLLGQLLATVAGNCGQYIAARFANIPVSFVQIGVSFKRELFGFNDRFGTRWNVGTLPIGGDIGLWNDPEIRWRLRSSSEYKRSWNRELITRALVVLSGPFSNFAVAFLVLLASSSFSSVYLDKPFIGGLRPNSPAERAGLARGDFVFQINETPINTFSQLREYVQSRPDDSYVIWVDRFDQQLTFYLRSEHIEDNQWLGGHHTIGVISVRPDDPVMLAKPSSWNSLGIAMEEFSLMFEGIISNFYASFVPADPRPPRGIARQATDTYLILFSMALLQITNGLGMLLPLPPAAGSRLLHYLYQGVSGRSFSRRWQVFGSRFGLLVFVCFLLIATGADFRKLLGI